MLHITQNSMTSHVIMHLIQNSHEKLTNNKFNKINYETFKIQ